MVSNYDTVTEGQAVRGDRFHDWANSPYDRLTPTEMVKYIADSIGMDDKSFHTSEKTKYSAC